MNPVARYIRLAGTATCILFMLWLAACASPPKPTVIQAALQVQPDVNPDARGRASPIVVKIYELKSLAIFNNADFFSLFEHNKETLGAELVAVDEFHLMPGETRRFERALQPDTQYLGVAAGFRDLERAQWRAATAVAPHQVSPVTIHVKNNQITITASP